MFMAVSMFAHVSHFFSFLFLSLCSQSPSLPGWPYESFSILTLNIPVGSFSAISESRFTCLIFAHPAAMNILYQGHADSSHSPEERKPRRWTKTVDVLRMKERKVFIQENHTDLTIPANQGLTEWILLRECLDTVVAPHNDSFPLRMIIMLPSIWRWAKSKGENGRLISCVNTPSCLYQRCLSSTSSEKTMGRNKDS